VPIPHVACVSLVQRILKSCPTGFARSQAVRMYPCTPGIRNTGTRTQIMLARLPRQVSNPIDFASPRRPLLPMGRTRVRYQICTSRTKASTSIQSTTTTPWYKVSSCHHPASADGEFLSSRTKRLLLSLYTRRSIGSQAMRQLPQRHRLRKSAFGWIRCPRIRQWAKSSIAFAIGTRGQCLAVYSTKEGVRSLAISKLV
jgi:hypothetical protein